MLVLSSNLPEDDLSSLTVGRQNSIANPYVENESPEHCRELKDLGGLSRQGLRNPESDLAAARLRKIPDTEILDRDTPAFFENAGKFSPGYPPGRPIPLYSLTLV